MIYNYYRRHNNYYKIKDYFEQPYTPVNENVSIKKKIKKLNEVNFFDLFSDVIYFKPIRSLTKTELEYFFIEKRRLYEQDENLPFSKSIESQSKNEKIIIETYITFNFKSEIKYIVNYLLVTKEYPKQILITKLLYLKERIIKDNISTLIYVKDSFFSISHSNENFEEMEKSTFIFNIIPKLVDLEEELYDLVGEIDTKINSFSTPNTGNYLITVDEGILEKLYFRLEKKMLIDQDKTSLKQFIEVLKLDWDTHNSIIYLEMNNIQFRYFIDCINQFLKTNIPLTFIQHSGNIRNNNGKIKASSMYTTGSNNSIKQKDLEMIKSIFEKL